MSLNDSEYLKEEYDIFINFTIQTEFLHYSVLYQSVADNHCRGNQNVS